MSALAALTLRTFSGTLRDADLLFAVLAPVGCFLGFTLALGNLIDTGKMTYPQYVLPLVIVQAMLFGAMTTADRAARDRLSGFGVRLRTLPIPAVVPLAARMLYCLIRAVIALVAGVAVASVFGFRMTGGLGYGAAVRDHRVVVRDGGLPRRGRARLPDRLRRIVQPAAAAPPAGAGPAVNRDGARRIVSRMARSVCPLPAGVAGHRDIAPARQRSRRRRRSGRHGGLVRWAVGAVWRLRIANAKAHTSEYRGQRERVGGGTAAAPLATRPDRHRPGVVVSDLPPRHLQIAHRQGGAGRNGKRQPLRAGSDVRCRRRNLRHSRRRPCPARRTRVGPADQVVGATGPSGERTERSSARRSGPNGRLGRGAHRIRCRVGFAVRGGLGRSGGVCACAGDDLGGGRDGGHRDCRPRGRPGHGDLAGRGMRRTALLQHRGRPCRDVSVLAATGGAASADVSDDRGDARPCRGWARACGRCCRRPCGPVGLVAVFAPMAVRGYRAAAEAGCR